MKTILGPILLFLGVFVLVPSARADCEKDFISCVKRYPLKFGKCSKENKSCQAKASSKAKDKNPALTLKKGKFLTLDFENPKDLKGWDASDGAVYAMSVDKSYSGKKSLLLEGHGEMRADIKLKSSANDGHIWFMMYGAMPNAPREERISFGIAKRSKSGAKDVYVIEPSRDDPGFNRNWSLHERDLPKEVLAGDVELILSWDVKTPRYIDFLVVGSDEKDLEFQRDFNAFRQKESDDKSYDLTSGTPSCVVAGFDDDTHTMACQIQFGNLCKGAPWKSGKGMSSCQKCMDTFGAELAMHEGSIANYEPKVKSCGATSSVSKLKACMKMVKSDKEKKSLQALIQTYEAREELEKKMKKSKIDGCGK